MHTYTTFTKALKTLTQGTAFSIYEEVNKQQHPFNMQKHTDLHTKLLKCVITFDETLSGMTKKVIKTQNQQLL